MRHMCHLGTGHASGPRLLRRDRPPADSTSSPRRIAGGGRRISTAFAQAFPSPLAGLRVLDARPGRPDGHPESLSDGLAGKFESALEDRLRRAPAIARSLIEGHFPPTVADEVLLAVGFDHEADAVTTVSESAAVVEPRRDASWRAASLEAWERQCAFCGFDGQVGERSHWPRCGARPVVRLDGQDSMDNGMALCMLHHNCSTAVSSDSTRTLLSWSRSASLLGRPTVALSVTCTVGR